MLRGRKTMAKTISIHRSLAGPDRKVLALLGDYEISIHRSLAGPDGACLAGSGSGAISIHRSLAGPDQRRYIADYGRQNFNPQVPCGTRRRAVVFR